MSEDEEADIELQRAEEQINDGQVVELETEEDATPVEDEPTQEDRLAAALAKVFPQAQPKEPEPKKEPVKLTPEQFKAKYKIRDADDNDVADLSSGDSVKIKALLNRVRDSIVEQAIAMGYDITQQQITPFQQQMASLTEAQAETVRERSQAEFFKTYPHFKGKEQILHAVTSSLMASGTFNPNNMKEAHKQIAQKADEMMKLVDANYVSPSTQNNNKKTTTTTRMASTSRGGQGGSGGGTVKPAVPLGIAVFD